MSLQYVCIIVCMFTKYYKTLLNVLQVDMTSLSPHRVCQHHFRMVYLSDHGYDAKGEIMEEVPAGGCFYIYLEGDFSFGRLPEEEQLVVISCVLCGLCAWLAWGRAPLARCIPRTRRSRRYDCGTRFRERDLVESSLSYTTRYFSLYECPGILVQNPFRRAKSIA